MSPSLRTKPMQSHVHWTLYSLFGSRWVLTKRLLLFLMATLCWLDFSHLIDHEHIKLVHFCALNSKVSVMRWNHSEMWPLRNAVGASGVLQGPLDQQQENRLLSQLQVLFFYLKGNRKVHFNGLFGWASHEKTELSSFRNKTQMKDSKCSSSKSAAKTYLDFTFVKFISNQMWAFFFQFGFMDFVFFSFYFRRFYVSCITVW